MSSECAKEKIQTEFRNNLLISAAIIVFSHITRQAQYNHPCLTSCYLYTTGERAKPIVPGPAHTQFNPHSALVPANPYLLEEIPAWLLIYVDGKSIRCHLLAHSNMTVFDPLNYS